MIIEPGSHPWCGAIRQIQKGVRSIGHDPDVGRDSVVSDCHCPRRACVRQHRQSACIGALAEPTRTAGTTNNVDFNVASAHGTPSAARMLVNIRSFFMKLLPPGRQRLIAPGQHSLCSLAAQMTTMQVPAISMRYQRSTLESHISGFFDKGWQCFLISLPEHFLSLLCLTHIWV